MGTKRVPKGRLNSIPQILLVEFDPVLLQQRQELLLERHIAMMLLLLADVANERVQLRHAHVERPIFFLPLEKSVEPPLINWAAFAIDWVAGSERSK